MKLLLFKASHFATSLNGRTLPVRLTSPVSEIIVCPAWKARNAFKTFNGRSQEQLKAERNANNGRG